MIFLPEPPVPHDHEAALRGVEGEPGVEDDEDRGPLDGEETGHQADVEVFLVEMKGKI